MGNKTLAEKMKAIHVGSYYGEELVTGDELKEYLTNLVKDYKEQLAKDDPWKNIPIVRFNYCPFTGEKIDWNEVRNYMLSD